MKPAIKAFILTLVILFKGVLMFIIEFYTFIALLYRRNKRIIQIHTNLHHRGWP